jgi:transposase InsO family protein
MCEALEAPAGGYYAWASRPGSPTEERRQELVGAIEEVHAGVRQRYRSPRMTAELKARGHGRSEDTVAELMSANGIRARAPPRFARTTDSNHRPPAAEDLPARDLEPPGPNEAWCADVTYTPTGGGWLYLAAVEDLFSRVGVGWGTAESMEGRLVVDAPEMALSGRRPGAGLPAHPDRGSRSASDHHQRVPAGGGIGCSMSGAGRRWGDAPVGSRFGRPKRGLEVEVVATRGRARAVLFGYLGVFYNRVRRHSSPGFLPPAEFERAHGRTHR